MHLEKGVKQMSSLIVDLSKAKKGLIVDKDVFVNSLYPVVKKETVLTEEHLEVLQLFAVKEIQVRKEGTVSRPKEEAGEPDIAKSQEKQQPKRVKIDTFPIQYQKAVEAIKKEFASWRAGISPDVAKVRAIIVPLLEQLERPESQLSFITNVTTEKDYLYHHSIAVGLLSFAIGKKMNLSSGEAVQLGVAGALIDSGMARVSPIIVNKTHRLTDNDLIEIRKHPIYSYQMVKDSPLLRTEMKLAIFQHHERLDGSGYPQAQKEKGISLYAQIIGVADVYHARTSDRIYRAKESPYKVLESFRNSYEKFDLKVINALYDIVGNLSIGTKVELSDGKLGIIIYPNPDEIFRPTVKLEDNDAIIDLRKNRELTVNRIV